MKIDTRTITTDIQAMIRAYLDNEKSKIDLNVHVSNNMNLENIEVLVQSKNYGCIRQISHYDLIDSRSKYLEIFALIIKPMVDELISKEKGSSQVSTFNSSEELVIKSLKSEVSSHALRIVKKLGSLKSLDNQINMSKIVIAGGCFVSWFHEKELHDIDVFFLDHFNTSFAGQAYISNVQDTHPNAIKKHDHYTRNNNMITKVFTEREVDTVSDYQYIFTKYKTRKDLIDHFDFAHTTISYNIGEDKLYITRKAYDALKNKKLIRNGQGDIAQWRVEKFLQRGWTKDKDFDKGVLELLNPVSDTFSTFGSLKTSDELLKKMASAALGS